MNQVHPRNELIDKLVAYAAALEPQFPQRIAGAPRSDMLELARYAQISLPDAYYGYFSRMGRSSGGIQLVSDGVSSFSEIFARYRDTIVPGTTKLPPGCLLLAMGQIAFRFLCVDLSEPGVEPVRFTSSTERKAILAESLEKLLYRQAFLTFGLKLHACYGIWSNTDDPQGVASFGRELERFGFLRQWFSDAVGFCGEREDARAYVEQTEGQATTVQLTCRNAAELESIGAYLELHQRADRDL